MAQINYIPAGRTSRILRGSSEIQIQTEYACRPNPRLTTSVFSGGRVIHKIEQELGLPISSQEDMMKVEGLLRRQHTEVIEIVDSDGFESYIKKHSEESNKNSATSSLVDRLKAIEGVEKVFRIGDNGEFESRTISDEFRKRFSAVFKNLREVLEIFQRLPDGKREEGVYAIEPGRLYLLSDGLECFFLLIDRQIFAAGIEKKLHSALKL